ncbi:MAG TPA: tRNA-dihydrouridine synthase family protein [Spirochaetota bacterium]|nr:tRNA-dihydrouridine synthase family protein [Spirochaetota bacterium]HPV41218.1 tRNA-dihydrouridine synthase family protein [Spirochaetota bacterium]
MDTLSGKFFLAPMAETSTPALRQAIKEICPETVVFSEMLSAGAIAARASNNEPMVTKRDFDDPLIYQIVGSDPDVMARACAILSGTGCFGVDINMGCPNHDIVKKGQGAFLLTDNHHAQSIIKACRKACPTRLSVKMRTGYEDNNEERFINFITMLEDEGVDFITVHPRYAKLSFRRKADWRLVALAKQHVSIPVIGNGDIDTPQSAIERMHETGCDGIMIGREAVKSPWIFKLATDLLNTGEAILEVNIHEIFISTLERIREYLPERLHKSRSHRFSVYYSQNARYGHALFTRIRKEETIGPIIDIVNDYFTRNSNEAIRHFHIKTGVACEAP